ncbi:MAG: insulinase family protein [Candidatus Kapaibacterium sp.]
MKVFRIVLCLIVVAHVQILAQYSVEQHKGGKFSYTTVKNDPMGVRTYTLANGLKVFISVNKNEPRVQTLISVRAGSKNDPADATGLAHYLEHMLFKGTDKYGSLDFSKEKPLIDKIENLYEEYRKTTDADKRKVMYHVIDSLSGEAAKFAIPNEYDKMVGSLGAKGTNAHTAVEETVYQNDIPSNQLRKWITLEAERFRNPILRLFHTELEAVYEEKNRGLDNDGRLAYEAMLEAVFPKHQYGTQTTIGTIEHLKNPSMKKIREYYAANYVPNNMAIILCGDVDPDKTVEWISEAFGSYQSKPLTPFVVAQEDPITKPVIREVFGPTNESVRLVFRFPGAGSKELITMAMCDMILSNSSVGLIDLNLKQQQKVLNAGCSPNSMKDYTLHIFNGTPRKGQKLEEVVELILGQIEELKKGNFSEDMMKSIVTNMRIDRMRSIESNDTRANMLSQMFIQGTKWEDELAELDQIAKVTKKEVMEFAKKWYNNNYVVVYKRSGENKNAQKVPKPAITPVVINKNVSDFAKKLMDTPADKLQPRFTDFNKDINKETLNGSIPVYAVKNTDNKLYTLQFIWDMGIRHDKKTGLALSYLDLLGTSTMTSEQVKEKFYALGSDITASANNEQFIITISGLQDNLAAAVQLTEEVLANAKPDNDALKLMVEGMIKQRTDMKKNKNVILQQAMLSYALYGKRNPFTDRLSDAEMRAVTAQELCDKIKQLATFKHKVFYYGPASAKEVTTTLAQKHKTPASLKDVPKADDYAYQDISSGGVLFLDYNMVQAEVLMRLQCDKGYNPQISPYSRLYNEYFGGGNMSSITFTTMRESKALAYSVDATFAAPRKKEDPYFMTGYIGTQADKLPEALSGMNELMNNMPRVDALFDNSKNAIIGRIESERITRMDILSQFQNYARLGLDFDVRKVMYEKIPSLTFDDVNKFHAERIKNKKFMYIVLGSKNKINMEELKKYGPVKEVTADEVFGY